MKKRILAVVLGAVMVMSLAGCGSGTSGEDKKASSDGEKTYTIGISQFAEHGSLDNCREGFLEGLKEEGIEEGKNLTVSVKNAAADQGTAKQISDSFVSDKVDLICAIATPSAQAAYNSAMDSEIPVVYTAVTDPVAAKIAKDDGTAVGNVTGTSDELPIKAQLEMIREMTSWTLSKILSSITCLLFSRVSLSYSKPDCTKEEKQAWLAQADGITLGSDAFFPFSDNIERAYKSGVKYVAQPGGSIRDQDVIDACNKHGMAMAFTGLRLFHH